jgi:hypothetical protein
MEATKKPTPSANIATSSMAITLSESRDAGAAATDPEVATTFDYPRVVPLGCA